MNLRLSTAPHIRSSATTQRIMLDVIIALVPSALAAAWYFGYRALILMAVAMVTAVLAEFCWQKLAKQPVRIADCSALLTGLLVGLNLPAGAPWWLALIGSLLAIILVKQVFGGIGDNFLNPALTARAILLASWPVHMTRFILPVSSFAAVDTMTSATPLSSGSADIWNLFAGNIPGTMGEVSKLMLLLGLAYLLIRGVISWRIPVITLASTALFTLLFGGDPLYAVLSGGVMFGAIFMATDYTTSPMTPLGQYVYAAGIGLIIAVIRKYGAYPEGVTYGILLMNVATPLIDRCIKPHVYGVVKPDRKGAKADA